MQGFTEEWTDEEPYKKYNFTDQENTFIKSMIKPMEKGVNLCLVILTLENKFVFLCNPQINQRPINRINPRRMGALKRETFSGGVLFGFQRQPSLAGAEDVGQIFSNIYAVCLYGVDNRIGSSTGVGSFRRGGKQPVFSADDKRFYHSFGQVVVYGNPRILKKSVKIDFLVSCILNRFGKTGSL